VARVRKSSRRLLKWDAAVHLGVAELFVVAAMSATLAVAAPLQRAPRLMDITDGEITAQALAKLTASMDPAMLALAARFAVEAQATAQARQANPGVAQASDTGDADVIRLQDLSPEAARIWNASNPIAELHTAPARPFKLNAAGVLDEQRAVDCMTAAIYYEAAMESTDGQRAVAQVVLNRMRHPAFPKSVCGVVFQGSNRKTGCQFSFTCDGSLGRTPSVGGWARAREVAVAALNGYVMKGVGNATHYHANYVAPYWSPSLHKVAVVGAHIFYRWTGGWGLPPAFSGSYAGGEMNGLQVATLDGLVKSQAQLDLAEAPETAPVITPVVDVKAAPAAAVAEVDQKLVTADNVAKDADALLPAQELDWAGRPKRQGAARIAMP
jgi:spore germination cell wall hydrolase CwlJ-like protein